MVGAVINVAVEGICLISATEGFVQDCFTLSDLFIHVEIQGVQGDSNPTISPENIGNLRGDSRIDSRTQFATCPDLARVVIAWPELSEQIKAVIVAIVTSASRPPL
jgi:hypothetical protein